MAKMEFEIVGEGEFTANRFVSRISKALDDLPDGRLLTTRSLAELLKYAVEYIRSRGALVPPKYRVLHANKMLYGNPKTVKAFTEQVQH